MLLNEVLQQKELGVIKNSAFQREKTKILFPEHHSSADATPVTPAPIPKATTEAAPEPVPKPVPEPFPEQVLVQETAPVTVLDSPVAPTMESPLDSMPDLPPLVVPAVSVSDPFASINHDNEGFAVSVAEWKCTTCGKINPSYLNQCRCGQKRDISDS